MKAAAAVQSHNWAMNGGMYQPVGEVVANIPAGIYEGVSGSSGYLVKPIALATDRLQTLKSSLPATIMASIQNFLSCEEKYKHMKLLYKRGIMMHGPPGNGKTLTTLAVAYELITKHDALVFSGSNLPANLAMMQTVRQMQPERPILNIMEDLETLRFRVSDQTILNMLDGVHQVNKIIHIATTNYLKALDPRYMGRPGRFDEIYLVSEPTGETIREYVVGLLPGVDGKHVDMFVALAKDMPMAYVKELVIGVEVLGQHPDVVAKRLREMLANAKAANKKNKNGEGMDYFDDEDQVEAS